MSEDARQELDRRIKAVYQAVMDLQQRGYELNTHEQHALDDLFALFLRNQWQVEYSPNDSASPSS